MSPINGSSVNGTSSPRVSFSMDRLHELDQPSTQSLKIVSTTQTASARIANTQSKSQATTLESILGGESLRALTGYSPSLRSKLSHWVADVRNYFRASDAVSRGGDSFGFAKVDKLAGDLLFIEHELRGLGNAQPSVEKMKQHRTAVHEFREALQSYVENKPGRLAYGDEILTKLEKSIDRLDIEIGRTTAGMKESALERVGVAKSLGPLTPLGKGAIGTVSLGNFSEFEGQGVFKPELDFSIRDEDGCINPAPTVMHYIGVPQKGSNMTGRAVASAVVNDLLELGLTGKTKFAVHDGKLGFLTEVAKGRSPQGGEIEVPGHDVTHKCTLFDLNKPELSARLTDLHLFDYLTGQIDRHWGNVFIDVSGQTDGCKVTAIDNDVSFGSMNMGINGKHSKLPENLPPIVPRETAEKFLNLRGQDLRAKLDGLLSPDEVNAAVARLQTIKNHLQKIGPDNQLDKNAWNQRDFSQEFTSKNSYVGKFNENYVHKFNFEQEKNVQLVFDQEGNHVKRPLLQAPSNDTVATSQVDILSTGKSLSSSELNSEKLLSEPDELIKEFTS